MADGSVGEGLCEKNAEASSHEGEHEPVVGNFFPDGKKVLKATAKPPKRGPRTATTATTSIGLLSAKRRGRLRLASPCRRAWSGLRCTSGLIARGYAASGGRNISPARRFRDRRLETLRKFRRLLVGINFKLNHLVGRTCKKVLACVGDPGQKGRDVPIGYAERGKRKAPPGIGGQR